MNNDKIKIKTLARLGQTRAFFSAAMPEILDNNEDTYVVTADLAHAFGMDKIMSKYPERLINVGIAEQNMVTVSSGLAVEGLKIFAAGYASFLATRSIEQVRLNVLATGANVKLVGAWAGVSLALGVSHYGLEDIAFMRALPDMIILSPADSLEAYKMAYAAMEIDRPVYIRLSGMLESPIVYKEDFDFVLGKAVKILGGDDVAIIATGLMVNESCIAAEILKTNGISASVYNFNTINPLDEKTLDEIFGKYRLVVTVEEHSSRGGLGGAVAEYKSGFSNMPKQLILGFPNHFIKAGMQEYMWGMAGISRDKIAERVIIQS